MPVAVEDKLDGDLLHVMQIVAKMALDEAVRALFQGHGFLSALLDSGNIHKLNKTG